MIAFIRPEEFRKRQNLLIGLRIYFVFGANNGLQHFFLLQAEARQLVVNDRIDGNGSLCQPERKRLLARREGSEAIGLNLDECGFVNSFD